MLEARKGRYRRLHRIVSWGITGAILAFGIVYGVRHADRFHLITTFSPGAIALLILLKLSVMACFGLQLRIVTRCYGARLTFLEWFGLSRATAATNILLPFGGTALKAVYLKQQHGFKYQSFVAGQVFARLLRIMVLSLLAVFLLLVTARVSGRVVVATVIVCAVAVLVLLTSNQVQRALSRRWPRLGALGREWQCVWSSRKTVTRLVAVNLVSFGLSASAVSVTYSFFGVRPQPLVCMLIVALTALSGVLNITPRNLGIQEAIFIAVSELSGLGANEGLHAAALQRVVGITMTIVLGLAFTRLLSRRAQPEPTGQEPCDSLPKGLEPDSGRGNCG